MKKALVPVRILFIYHSSQVEVILVDFLTPNTIRIIQMIIVLISCNVECPWIVISGWIRKSFQTILKCTN